jgi:hypothetical protein
VLQQAAEPGVMKLLGSGGFAIGLGKGGIVEHRGEQQLEVGVGEAVDEAEKLTPQRAATS